MRVGQYLMGMEKLGILTLEDAFMGHAECDMDDQSCTVAVKLKTITLQAGKTIEDVVQAGLEAERDRIAPTLPELSSLPPLTLRVGSYDLSLPLEVIEGVTTLFIDRSRKSVADYRARLTAYGVSLARSALRPQVALPALELPMELIGRGVMCSKDRRTYLFYIPIAYKPVVISYSGNLYQLDNADANSLEREVLLQVTLTENLAFYHMMLVRDDGTKFHHYHSRPTARAGHGEDCWGSVKPLDYYHKPDLRTLLQLATVCQQTLATINQDSIFNSHPPGMPAIGELRERAALAPVMTAAHPPDGVRVVLIEREEVRAWRV